MTNFRRSPLSERIFRFQTVVFTCQRTLQAATGGLWRVSAGLPGILGLWRPAEQVSSIVFYRGLKRKRISQRENRNPQKLTEIRKVLKQIVLKSTNALHSPFF